MNSVREAERLAECSGVPVIRLKVTVFIIACALAGMAGSLQAHYIRFVGPEAYSGFQSLNLVVMNVIGGMSSLYGAMLGTVFMVTLPELLRGYVNLQQIMFGAILFATMAFLPGGLIEAGRRLKALLVRAAGRAPRHMTELLSVAGLCKSFGGLEAVSDLSFTVGEGEILGIIGPNGAGKTTAVNLISGVIKPSSGRVLLAGTDATGLAPHALVERGLVRTFQATTVYAEPHRAREPVARGLPRHLPGLLGHALQYGEGARGRASHGPARRGGHAVARSQTRREPSGKQPALRLPEGAGHGHRPCRPAAPDPAR